MGLVRPEHSCCGCGVCALVCPVRAITMSADPCGYIYPVIDESRCIGCGKCEKMCAYGDPSLLAAPLDAYAAVGADRTRNRGSASGGVFAALAHSCVRNGAMAAGAVMDCGDAIRVYHLLSDRAEDVVRMQGSKYVQSDMSECCADLLPALKAGKTVLFSGTPCQVAAVKKLTGDPENLITADLICHGVPAGKMLTDFGKILEKRFFRKKLTGLCFRDKTTEKSFCARLEFGSKQILQRSHSLSYYDAFLRGASYRESCYSCPYARMERAGDLTLGDYWGIQKEHGQLAQQEKHWSCLLVNSEKGRKLLERCAGDLDLHPTDPKKIQKENHQLRRPSQKTSDRQQLLERYARGGYGAVEREFVKKNGGALRFWLRCVKSWFSV